MGNPDFDGQNWDCGSQNIAFLVRSLPIAQGTSGSSTSPRQGHLRSTRLSLGAQLSGEKQVKNKEVLSSESQWTARVCFVIRHAAWTSVCTAAPVCRVTPALRCATIEAGFRFCCPPPFVAAVGAPPCPTAADSFYAWNDFVAECPIQRCGIEKQGSRLTISTRTMNLDREIPRGHTPVGTSGSDPALRSKGRRKRTAARTQ
eukprot:2037800-Rhodomonas_salina.2